MVVLTRKVHFSASHRYHNPALSDDENRRIFGKCNNPHGHGHNYLCEVSVRGETDAQSGMVIDLRVLNEVLEDVIMRRYDHKNINLDVPEFAQQIPTTENIAVDIWRQVSQALPTRAPGCTLHRIRLYEDPTLFVEYYGE
jgi:6-pyruvoyltetrahydropterin/6-carboxytetrahydropterin synthase